MIIDSGLIKNPIPSIFYDDAISILKSHLIEIEWGEDIGVQREQALSTLLRNDFGDAFFVQKYPEKVKKFYIKTYPDRKYTHSFDLIYKGWEVASGGLRETDTTIMRERMDNFNGGNLEEYYLRMFHRHISTHGGFGFGIERFLARALNLHSINDGYFSSLYD